MVPYDNSNIPTTIQSHPTIAATKLSSPLLVFRLFCVVARDYVDARFWQIDFRTHFAGFKFVIAVLLSEITDAFKLFDKNGDGKISAEELGEAMKQAGQELPEDELKDMIKAVDRNGEVILYEFSP